jgi:PHD/YefM family antitoxin component YafN of YafNO toxin-antitoxin module
MPDHPSKFAFMSIDQFQSRLNDLHQKVCCDNGRVEIHDGDNVCVLISKDELDALEQALEILSNTSDVQTMARTIASLTRSAAAEAPVVVGIERNDEN